jgi:hypothetical protein
VSCEFKEETAQARDLTLYSTDGSNCKRPTAVYLPSGRAMTAKKPNVVLWLHGLYVKDFRQHLFGRDTNKGEAKVREQIRDAKKDVVMIAPFTGGPDSNSYYSTVPAFANANWGQDYLDRVLMGISGAPKPAQPAAQKGTATDAGATAAVPEIANLVIACHSAGGQAMRNIVTSLGRYQENLKECWGFDCLYGQKIRPDDADYWYKWIVQPTGRPLYIYYGHGTSPQSRKLGAKGHSGNLHVQQAARPGDHYGIASQYFLERLKQSDFL